MTKDPLSPQHRAALHWAKHGLPVFPCRANSKAPATPNGFKNATTDRDQIDEWWSENPQYNPASCPDDSGHFVVDVDPRNGGDLSLLDLELKNGGLPQTFTVKTPSGGQHFWFKGSAKSSTSRIAPGIDIKGRGGYVLLPGATINGVPYE
jgi:hypothetical protein